MAFEAVTVPKLDFSLLESGTTAVWDTLQGQVMHALEYYGCFEAEYDKVTPELRDAFFGRALPELFALPVDTKLLNRSGEFLEGYIGQVPGWAYESLRVQDDVDKFTRMLWPQGNHTFSDTVSTYIRHMIDLDQIIVRMIFVALDIEKYYDPCIKSTNYETQLIEYGIPLDQESMNGMGPHIDQHLISIICRNQVKGLEIQTKGGEWIPVEPSSNSFTVIIGEAIQAWTNGRLQAPVHRVKANLNVKRHSIVFGSIPKDGCVQTPKELVDAEQPKPFLYLDQKLLRYPELRAGVGSTMYHYGDIKEEGSTMGISDLRAGVGSTIYHYGDIKEEGSTMSISSCPK